MYVFAYIYTWFFIIIFFHFCFVVSFYLHIKDCYLTDFVIWCSSANLRIQKHWESDTLRGINIGRMNAAAGQKSACDGERPKGVQPGEFVILPQQMVATGDFFLWFLYFLFLTWLSKIRNQEFHL